MFTLSQLRNCIEEGLSPLTCEFTLCRDASLTLKVFDAETGRVDLVVTGIDAPKSAADPARSGQDGRRITLRAAQQPPGQTHSG